MNAAPKAKPKAKPSANPIKRGLIGKVHVAKSQLALSDEDYEAILGRITGKASSKGCSVTELEAVLTEFKRLGWVPKKTAKAPKRAAAKRPLAAGDEARKARALWIALYHLGVVKDPAEGALEAFLKRQSGGIEKLQWMNAEAAYKVIEGLKAMAARPVAKGGGGVDWGSYATPTGRMALPRRCVIEAQARILGWGAADLRRHVQDTLRQPGVSFLTEDEQDRLIEALGTAVRKVRAG